MKRLPLAALAVATLALYAGVIAVGVRLHPAALAWDHDPVRRSPAWHMAAWTSLSPGKRQRIESGHRLFRETPLYAPAYVSSRITCANCHTEGGTTPYASPVVGIVPSFPMFSKRSGRNITLEDRIEECMTRSENGAPLPSSSPEMQSLVAYIVWLSEPHPGETAFTGRGLAPLPALVPNPAHGAQVYAGQCAGCHGTHGEGTRRPFPPLWGPDSFNDGAGMNGIDKMAAFIQRNMPQNRKGILSPQDAYDVAAYIHQQPRPAYNHAYDRF